MIAPLVLAALVAAFVGGMFAALGDSFADIGRIRHARKLRRVAVTLVGLALLLAFGPLANASDTVTLGDVVAEVPGVAKFTTQRGDCPRLHRIAVAPNGARGCWTIGEIDRRITIRWDDGRVVEWSAVQFDIYAK